MERRIVITAGTPFIDIDAAAAAHGYAELLRRKGQNALFHTSGSLNKSVTRDVRAWLPEIGPYEPCADDRFILVDISDPAYFDPIVNLDAVIEVVDHHSGFEGYWGAKLPGAAHIDRVGSCCTQIFEKWAEAGKLGLMTSRTVKLMLAGIIENTLDLKASATTDRDRRAYRILSGVAYLPQDWSRNYFTAVQESIEQDLQGALALDLKRADIALLPPLFAQMAVWDAEAFLSTRKHECVSIMNGMGKEWVVNILSVSHAKSYLLCASVAGREKLASLCGASFEGDVAVLETPVLRKEFFRSARNIAV